MNDSVNDSANVPDPDCLICTRECADPEDVVWSDDLFACSLVPGFEVPGWVVVRVRRHTIGWPGLDEAERARVGDAIAETVTAVRTATGADKVYVLTFGEAFPHFHALVAPRPDDLPVELRLGRILDRREHDLDVPTAREVAARVRAAYEQQAGDRGGAV